MPPLEMAPPLSRFEFWAPKWFYLPVWVWAAWLAARHLGLRLPLVANPAFPASGLVGESKSTVLEQAGPAARHWIARHVAVERGAADASLAIGPMRHALAQAGLDFPLVAKPDLGCRGAGVRPVNCPAELQQYVAAFPHNQTIILQEMVDSEGEAGVFYVRFPGEQHGRIFSLTLKYFPHVTGDGQSSLRTLIQQDSRAGRLTHLYFPRHGDRLEEIIPAGESVRLAFAGSHSRGAIFRNGSAFVTSALTRRFDAIASDIPEFWFGRFDVRFDSFAEFQKGEGFRIVEINGAGAEATHIWDSRTRLRDAYRTLFQQYSLLWKIGAANRSRGFRPEPWLTFFGRWRTERNLVRSYPPTA